MRHRWSRAEHEAKRARDTAEDCAQALDRMVRNGMPAGDIEQAKAIAAKAEDEAQSWGAMVDVEVDKGS